MKKKGCNAVHEEKRKATIKITLVLGVDSVSGKVNSDAENSLKTFIMEN